MTKTIFIGLSGYRFRTVYSYIQTYNNAPVARFKITEYHLDHTRTFKLC
jgi:hypothetical protein